MKAILNRYSPAFKTMAPKGRTLGIIIGLELGAMLIMALLMINLLYEQRAHTLEGAGKASLFEAELVTQEMKITLEGVEQMLHGINIFLSAMQDRADAGERIRNLLFRMHAMNPLVTELLVLDRHGAIQYWTGTGPLPDVRDRAYSLVPQQDNFRGMYVGNPVISRVRQGRKILGCSIAARDEEGRLSNILVAIMDLEHLHDMLEKVDRPDHVTITLARPMGTS